MRKYGKWALTLGLLAAAPGITLADGGPAPAAAKQAGKSYNQQTAEKIAEALRKERLAAYEVDIEFKDGVATIKGEIATKKQKQRVHDVVAKVPGVTQVDDSRLALSGKKSYTNRMKAQSAGGVVQAGHQGGRDNRVQQVNHEAGAESQEQKQAKAEEIGAALSGANLDGYDIGIKYQSGVAVLEGSVPTNAQRAQAEHVASTVPGVRSVANELQVTEERPMPSPARPGAGASISTAWWRTMLSGAEGPAQKTGRGMRLIGPKLELFERPAHLVRDAGAGAADIVDDVIPLGGIQVPGGIEPIVMGVENPTAGGYAKIATVISTDMGKMGQLVPGSTLGFKAIEASAAADVARAQWAALKRGWEGMRP